jgi:hypothetical protein
VSAQLEPKPGLAELVEARFFVIGVSEKEKAFDKLRQAGPFSDETRP